MTACRSQSTNHFQHVLDSAAQKKLTNVTRWFKTVCAQPVVKEVVGTVQLCSSASSFDGQFAFCTLIGSLHSQQVIPVG